MVDKIKKTDKVTFESVLKSVSNLVQNRGKDRAVLEKMATKILWIKQINIESRFDTREDKDFASKSLDDYLTNYDVESYGDAQTIADLCFEELLKQRIQERIAKAIANQANNYIPGKDIDVLHEIENRIMELKDRAGILVKKDQDALNALQELEKKFQTYIVFNRNEFTLYAPYTCSKCKTDGVQPLLLRRNVKDFSVLRHPYLVGRYLWNTSIMNDYRDGKITKEMAASYQKTSPQMIEWMHDNRYKILEIEDVPQEDVNAFIDKCPYLPSSTEQKQ